MLKRSKNVKSYKEHWQLPEGKPNRGETDKQALTRELEEELEYTPKKIKYIGTSVVYKFIIIRIVRSLFSVPEPNKILLSREHSQYKYMNYMQAMGLKKVAPGTKEALRFAQEKGVNTK